ncbi:uncharacterized protein BKA78DRAFT_67338 [Phyllosticta capitalensis]|uniref:uncharacterized protein n=1 Tax=Phyllosticta capitalensis TaxID=121624 RepID=UPI00312D6EB6
MALRPTTRVVSTWSRAAAAPRDGPTAVARSAPSLLGMPTVSASSGPANAKRRSSSTEKCGWQKEAVKVERGHVTSIQSVPKLTSSTWPASVEFDASKPGKAAESQCGFAVETHEDHELLQSDTSTPLSQPTPLISFDISWSEQREHRILRHPSADGSLDVVKQAQRRVVFCAVARIQYTRRVLL